MVGVYVRELDGDETLNHLVSDGQTLSKETQNDLVHSIAKSREALELLDVPEAVLDDALELLVHQLDALEAGVEQESNLLLYEELECDFGHEQGGPRPHGVVYGVENVRVLQPFHGLDATQRVGEGRVEDVAYAGATGYLVGVDVSGVTLNLLAVGAGELCERVE